MEVGASHQEQSFLRQQLETERQRVFSLGQVSMTLLHGETLLHPFKFASLWHIYQEMYNL